MDIGKELEHAHFGILCTTPANLSAPWLLFEAGALSKSLGEAHVTPLLIGVKNSDLEGPLAQFNTTGVEKPEIWKLLKTINEQLGESALLVEALAKSFETWWPELNTTLLAAVKDASERREENAEPARSETEILEELLELTRSIARQVAAGSQDNYLSDAEQRQILLSVFPDLQSELKGMTWSRLRRLSISDIERIRRRNALRNRELNFSDPSPDESSEGEDSDD